MRQYDAEKALLSIHVPKCGGTSLRQWLESVFPGRVRFHYFDEFNNRLPIKHRLEPGIVIHGHFNRKRGFGVQDYYPEAEQFITFLRDPIEVVISRYQYEKLLAKRQESFREGKPLVLPDDLDVYLQQEICNKDYHPNILDYLPWEVQTRNFRELIEQHFIYIGLIEDYPFSIIRLSEKLGVTPVAVPHLNQSAVPGEVLESLRREFESTHALECEIYHYVREHYRTW
jgi:hypothetical protein